MHDASHFGEDGFPEFFVGDALDLLLDQLDEQGLDTLVEKKHLALLPFVEQQLFFLAHREHALAVVF